MALPSIDSRRVRSPARVALALVLAAIAVLPYLNGLTGDFTFDDVFVIRDNPAVQEGQIYHLLTTAYHPGALYRPLTMLTYAANARFSAEPFHYHAVNVILHAAVTVCTYLLARQLLVSDTAAIVAAALFAVHPCHTEAVTSIVGRAEVLAALLVIVSLLALGRALEAPGRAGKILWGAGSLLALCGGILAKESAFAAIALVPALHWCLRPQASLKERVQLTLPFVAVGLAYLGLRLIVVGSLGLPTPPDALDNPLAHVALSVRLATALIVLWEYVALLVLPVHLAADYSFNAIPLVLSPFDSRFLVAIAAFALAAALAAVSVRRIPGLAISVWFIVVPLAVTANLLFPIGTIKAERLLYLPSLGYCLLAAALSAQALNRGRRAYGAALLLIMVTFASRTWARNYDWQDNGSLFEATVAASSDSAKAHYNIGVMHQDAGRIDEAFAHYRRALAIYPGYAAAAWGMARLYSMRGNDEAALGWYEEALRRNWQLAEVHLNLGLIHQQRAAFSSAEAAFRTGLSVDPESPRLLLSLSVARLSQGDRWEALSLIKAMDRVRLTPEQVEVVAGARLEMEEALR